MSADPPEQRESVEPLAYATVDAGAKWGPAKPPGPPLRGAVVCGGISLVAGLVAFMADPAVSSLVGWPTALAAVILAAIAARRNSNPGLASRDRQAPRRISGAMGAAAVLLIGQTWLVFAGLDRAREYAKAAVSAVHLRLIGHSIAIYTKG